MQNLQVQRSKWRTLKEAKTETIKEKLKSWESSSAAGGLKVKDARFTFTDQRWSNATYMSRYRSLYYFISFILPFCISSNYIPYPIIVGSVCRGSPLNLPWSKAHVVPEEVKEGGLSVSLQLESYWNTLLIKTVKIWIGFGQMEIAVLESGLSLVFFIFNNLARQEFDLKLCTLFPVLHLSRGFVSSLDLLNRCFSTDGAEERAGNSWT